VKRTAGLLVAVLLLCAGCRGGDATPGVDQQVGDIESTLDTIESELGGDG
jgi:hypothetical protein